MRESFNARLGSLDSVYVTLRVFNAEISNLAPIEQIINLKREIEKRAHSENTVG